MFEIVLVVVLVFTFAYICYIIGLSHSKKRQHLIVQNTLINLAYAGYVKYHIDEKGKLWVLPLYTQKDADSDGTQENEKDILS